MKNDEFILMPIPASSFAAVCALLGGASLAAVAAPAPKYEQAGGVADETVQTVDDTGGDVSTTDGPGEIDAHGHPWSADLHASTKGKTKDGLWRMKVGVSRPDPKPGFPLAEGAPTGTAASGAASEAGDSATTATAASTAGDEDDEFAAFRAADAKSGAKPAEIPARKWTDADLGALCNQAAVKLGDPAPVKTIIANFVPEGQVAHSRNIPEDKREDFAKAVEAKAGIQYVG